MNYYKYYKYYKRKYKQMAASTPRINHRVNKRMGIEPNNQSSNPNIQINFRIQNTGQGSLLIENQNMSVYELYVRIQTLTSSQTNNPFTLYLHNQGIPLDFNNRGSLVNNGFFNGCNLTMVIN